MQMGRLAVVLINALLAFTTASSVGSCHLEVRGRLRSHGQVISRSAAGCALPQACEGTGLRRWRAGYHFLSLGGACPWRQVRENVPPYHPTRYSRGNG